MGVLWFVGGFVLGFGAATRVMQPSPVELEEVELAEEDFPEPPPEWGEEAVENPEVATFTEGDD